MKLNRERGRKERRQTSSKEELKRQWGVYF